MGYAILMFNCLSCGNPATGNPDKVPSFRVRRNPDGTVTPDPK